MDDARRKRIAEVLPGGLVWTTLILAVFLSFAAPSAVIFFIIVFDLFWLFRVSHFIVFLVMAWRRHRHDVRVDWLAKARLLPAFDRTYHVVLLPTAKEDEAIIRATLDGLLASDYPVQKKMIVVLGGEERCQDVFLPRAEALARDYGERFFRFLVTVHPKDLPGEIIGKGANVNWMGHRAKELIDGLGMHYDDVIVSSFDVDTCVHEKYFSCLTHAYLSHPTPTRTSYQPIALYHNNIWDAPAAVRVAAFGTTFWLMAELAKPDKLFTFSSHSMPMRMLVDVGFWEKDVVSEDSRIFLQALLHYNGDYRVTPMYVPVSMDAVTADGYWKSLVALYKQQRRWAWGVEHFPYLIDRFRKAPDFPLRKKLYYLWTVIEGMYTWATAALLIFILGRLPLWVAPTSLRGSAFFHNTPHTLELLMQLAMLGIFVSAALAFGLLPKRPSHKPWTASLIMLIQWAFVPITSIVFGAFPAIDAQTRLMLGKYMGFNVTEKKRKQLEAETELVPVGGILETES